MRVRPVPLCGLLAGLLLLSGCQRLNENRDVQLTRGQAKTLLFDAPRYEQKLTVEAHSPGVPISACVVKESEHEQAEGNLLNGKTPVGALAGTVKGEDLSLSTTIPAGTAFALVLYNAGDKETTVKVKVTGR